MTQLELEKYAIDQLYSVLRCPTCAREEKIRSIIGMLLLHLSADPSAQENAALVRKHLMDGKI